MAGYDPFSGGGYQKETYSKPKNNKLQPLITKVIVIVAILGIVGYGVYYLFFNNVIVSFNIKDTEGKAIDASIKITKVGDTKSQTIYSGEEIKLKKNSNYTYNITVQDYKPHTRQKIETQEDNEITVVLEKNLKFAVKNILCPETVYLGQRVVCEINVENTSTNETYDVDSLVFLGLNTFEDFKNKTYKFVNIDGEEISTARKTILPTTNTTFLLSFVVSSDKKEIGKKTLEARIKYTLGKKTASFNIVEAPNITFSSDISSAKNMVSGEEKKYTYTIDNSKGSTSVNNMIFSIDAEYINNYDQEINIDEIISKDNRNIEIEPKSKKTGQITIKLPVNIREGKIQGNLLLEASAFPESKKIPFTIDISEPEIKFNISLNKNSESLTYDEETQTTNEKIIILKLENQNAVNVKLIKIEILDHRNDSCLNWLSATSIYDNNDIRSKDKAEIPIEIKGKELLEIENVIGTKLCAIKVIYENPFTEESIEKINNITISVS